MSKNLTETLADLMEQSWRLGKCCEGMRKDEYSYPVAELADLVLTYARAINDAERSLACRAGRLAKGVKNLTSEEIIALAHEFKEKHPGAPPPKP